MPIDPNRLRYLLQQYAADDCTSKELLELLQAIDEAGNNPPLEDALRKLWLELGGTGILPVIDKEKIFSSIISNPAFGTPVVKRLWPRRVAVAAVIFILFGTGATIWRHFAITTSPKIARSSSLSQNDVAPGSNRAMLTLADGSTIVLDSLHNGAIRQQGNTKLTKQDSGQLVYRMLASGSTTIQFNTIATPRGGQFKVVLPDGTKVWLNASSSLRFPTAFSQHTRRVELKGEAYFEIAPDASSPFSVDINGKDEIQVLGTHFNVNAYDDEAYTRATLLEGSIRLSHGRQQVLLKPGQQAVSDRSDEPIQVIPDADTEAAIAWKNGYFQFDGADIRTVMRQLARWYDIDVTYEGSFPERQFAGQMPRGANLSEVLRILEESNVHFRIEGKKLVVTP